MAESRGPLSSSPAGSLHGFDNPRLRRHLGYAAVVSFLMVLVGYPVVLPVFRSHLMTYLSIGDAGFGMLFSVGAASSIVSVLFGGALLDRWGPRRVIRLGLVGMSGAMFIAAFGGRAYWAFVIAVAVAGMFSVPLSIAVTAYLARLFPRHQRRIISLNLASTAAGAMVFPLVAEGLLTLSGQSATVRFSHVLHLPFALAGVLLISATLIFRPRRGGVTTSPRNATCRPFWQWRHLILPRRTFYLAMLIAAHGVTDSTLGLWMPRFLESESFDAVLIAPGVVLAANAAAYVVSRLLLGALPDGVGRRAFMAIPGMLGGCLMVAGILSRQYWLTAAAFVVGAFCWSFEYPSFVSAVLRHDGRRFGTVMAVSGVLGSLLAFVAMSGMGLLIARLGEQQMWMAMCIPAGGFIAVGLGGMIWALRYEHEIIPAGAPGEMVAAPVPVAVVDDRSLLPSQDTDHETVRLHAGDDPR